MAPPNQPNPKGQHELRLVPPPRTALLPEDREALIATLAELVDYQANQALSGPTVKAGGGFTRRPEAGKRRSGR